jgi:hypothetical protein
MQAVIENTTLSKAEKARKLTEMGLSFANTATAIGVRYQQVYQAIHGERMRTARKAKESGEEPTGETPEGEDEDDEEPEEEEEATQQPA